MKLYDPMDRILAEKRWLDLNPQFEQRPATIREFVGTDYLNIEAKVRPGIMEVLIEVFGNQIDPEWISVKRKAVMTGGIGIGKTTFASIVLPYMIHWVYCLRDPQDYFDLTPGSRIAFMMMSTSERQAKEVLFGDVKARIDNSPWFQRYCKRDTTFENQVRFDQKELWIIPGGSQDTRFEGYNILGGVIDEGDSHKKTERKDYAEDGYDTIHERINSRFMNYREGKNKGILIIIGQTKSATGFMRKIYNEFKKDPDASATRMAIWESVGWYKFTENERDAEDHRETAPRKSFIFDIIRKEIIPRSEAIDRGLDFTSPDGNFIEVPIAYISGFIRNPIKALRDLAGIPPESTDPFISLTHRITACQDLWTDRNGKKSPVTSSSHDPVFEPWFQARERMKRVIHVDMAYSAEGDALGMAMAHIPEVVEIDGELKPLIVFDFLMRIHAAPGTEIILSEVRKLIYRLKFELKFNVHRVTMDGFEGVDFRQQLAKNKIYHETLSVDKKKQPYEDLRDAIYDERALFPPYMTKLNKGDTDLINIAFKELSQLEDTGKKIDHPIDGSKDVADAMAACVHYLMEDAQYRRGAVRVRRRDRLDEDNIIIPKTDGMPVPSGDSGVPLTLDDFLAGKGDNPSPVSLDAREPISFDNFDPKGSSITVDWFGNSFGGADLPW